jgi:hypothetical protein
MADSFLTKRRTRMNEPATSDAVKSAVPAREKSPGKSSGSAA